MHVYVILCSEMCHLQRDTDRYLRACLCEVGAVGVCVSVCARACVCVFVKGWHTLIISHIEVDVH